MTPETTDTETPETETSETEAAGSKTAVTDTRETPDPRDTRDTLETSALVPIVIFDLDNTLVHSRIDFLGIRTLIINRLLAVGALAEPPANPRVRAIPEWLDVAAAFDPLLAADLWRAVDRFERAGMIEGTVEDDARATLDHLHAAGLKLAVLTNNSLESAEAALDRFGLRTPFDLVLARDVVPALKPSGVGVAKAHGSLGGGPTYMVGDSYIDGLAAQRAAVGARFVAFRANLADLEVRGVTTWAATQALSEVPPLLLAATLT